jgi:hypothetical protein
LDLTGRKWREAGEDCIMRRAFKLRRIGNAYNFAVGKREGRKPHGRPRHRREDDIRMHLREIVWERVDWLQLAQDRDQWWVNTIMNLCVP